MISLFNLQHGVKDACSQHTLTSYFAVTDDQGICELTDVDVVRAVYENNVHASHARSQRDDAPGHDLVFAEESLVSNVPAKNSKSNDDDGEDGAPPAVQQRGVVADACTTLWWRCIVDVARNYHYW